MENEFSISIKPQYVRHTEIKEMFPDGQEHYLHEVQKQMKENFESLPEFVIISAPTGTGKSYAFPFPVLKSKKPNVGFLDDRSLRALIVLPTNALIDELTENFKKTYKNLSISRLTGAELDEQDAKGFSRWETALNICKSNDIVITNPDILNFAMHGGYHKFSWTTKTGDKAFYSFLRLFDYIVFDEYHLYDEAQIANILTLIKLKNWWVSGHLTRFFFVSATPETGLKRLLEAEGYSIKEIIEEITDDPHDARPIHGHLEVEFIKNNNIHNVVLSRLQEIEREIATPRRALIIVDKLRDVQELAETLRAELKPFNIYQSTGYESRKTLDKEGLENANIIIATNKAEVGVNYGVEYGIMQPGKYFQNFVQRFGRFSRGNLSGKIVVAISDGMLFAKVKNALKDKGEFAYGDFMVKMRDILQEKKFYDTIVPRYMGEYLWSINANLYKYQEYEVWEVLDNEVNQEGFLKGEVKHRFYILKAIDDYITAMIQRILPGKKISKRHWKEILEAVRGSGNNTTVEWVEWWERYQDTYLTFRDGSKTVEIHDEFYGKIVDYSLDWILQNKTLRRIERSEDGKVEKYIVGGLKDRDKDIQYRVSTIPAIGCMENNLVTYEEMFKLTEKFKSAVENIMRKAQNGTTWSSRQQLLICQKLLEMSNTFNRKRLKIEEITGNDGFL